MIANARQSRDLVELSIDRCWQLLEAHQYGVGRLAFSCTPHGCYEPPELLPVNYLLDGSDVIIQTGAGRIQAAGLDQAPVSFEIDSVSSPSRYAGHGWSVVAKGHAALVEAAEGHRYRRLMPLAQAPLPEPRTYLRLRIRHLAGRSF